MSGNHLDKAIKSMALTAWRGNTYSCLRLLFDCSLSFSFIRRAAHFCIKFLRDDGKLSVEDSLRTAVRMQIFETIDFNY